MGCGQRREGCVLPKISQPVLVPASLLRLKHSSCIFLTSLVERVGYKLVVIRFIGFSGFTNIIL